jgi:hypothetical protein
VMGDYGANDHDDESDRSIDRLGGVIRSMKPQFKAKEE